VPAAHAHVGNAVTQPAAQDHAPRCTASVLTAPADIVALAGEWAEFERQCEGAVFFQSPVWSLLACRTFQTLHGHEFRPLIVTVRRGRELVGIAPLRVTKLGPLHIATDLTEPFGQYGGMLVADADGNAFVDDVVSALRAVPNVDGLCLRRVRADSPVHAALLRHGFAAGAADAAPFIDLRPFGSFQAYQQTMNAKSRKNLRNLRNRLARVGPISHRVVAGDDLERIIDGSFEGRLRWLDEHGIPSMAFGHSAFGEMLRGVRELAQRDEVSVLAMGLYCGDVAVSLQWGFTHRGRYYAYIAARNPDFDPYSPGRLHLEDIIRTCFERRIEICDFLAPSVPYKLTFTEHAAEVVDIAVPFTIAGRLWLDAWDRRMRPTLKSRYLRLPLWLRRRIRRMAAEATAA
jgi:CelD/BcsL family acetyltransferase involved in cellulose biosynthesis